MKKYRCTQSAKGSIQCALRLSSLFTVLLACEDQQGDVSCTVEDTPEGALITCPDGTQTIVRDGEDGSSMIGAQQGANGQGGSDGVEGQDGRDVQDGSDGQDGTSCTVEETLYGALIVCEDGTQVLVEDGDDASCTVEDTDDGALIRCSDGTEGLVRNGVDSSDGSDGQTGTDSSKSGSRLKIYTVTGSDGSLLSHASYFYDTQLDVPCYVARHTDGSIRCLPTSYQATVSSYYSDDSCSTTLAYDLYSVSAIFTDPPVYVSEMLPDESAERGNPQGPYRYRIYELGTAYSGTLFNVASDSSCQESTLIDYDFYAIGDEIPSSTFVEFTVE